MKDICVRKIISLLIVALLLTALTFESTWVNAESQKELVKTPENLVVKQTGAKGLLLTWKKVKDAKGYEVYKGVGSLGGYKKVKTVKKTKYMDKHVKLGRSGTYKVRAYKYSKGKKVYSKYTNISANYSKLIVDLTHNDCYYGLRACGSDFIL